MLIRDELMNDGSIDEAPLYVRQVIARALHLGSAALILVHNHPTTPISITLDHAQYR